MGYSTSFKGELKFSIIPTVPLIKFIKGLEGKDWGGGYFDLELNDEMDGIEWSGAEKTRDMVGAVNHLLTEARKQWPNFGLAGELKCQGEDPEDRWVLLIKDGQALKIETPPIGVKAKCPDCGHSFYVEGTP